MMPALTSPEKRLYLGVNLVVLFFSLLTLLKPPVVSLTIKTPRPAPGKKWSLNSATMAQLESINGVGPVIAGNIISRREQLHGFKSWPAVLTVKGIGPKKLKLLRENIPLDFPTELITPSD